MDNRRAGFTLLEVMISITIIGMIVSLIYGSVAKTADSKDSVEQGNDIYHQARWAMDKMESDLSTAFVSKAKNSYTLFYGVSRDGANGYPQDEVHITSFSHIKLDSATTTESDQGEISYFVMNDPESGLPTLYRREDSTVDQDNMDGGEFYDLVQNVLAFNLRYFDGETWVDDWDSRNLTADTTDQTDQADVQSEVAQEDVMVNAVPLAVEITMIVGAPNGQEIPFNTKVRVMLSTIDLTTQDEQAGADDDGSGTTGTGSGTGTGGKGKQPSAGGKGASD